MNEFIKSKEWVNALDAGGTKDPGQFLFIYTLDLTPWSPGEGIFSNSNDAPFSH